MSRKIKSGVLWGLAALSYCAVILMRVISGLSIDYRFYLMLLTALLFAILSVRSFRGNPSGISGDNRADEK